MNSTARQTTTGNTTGLCQFHFQKQPLPGRLYLLERSLDRYTYLKKHSAPDILVDAEKNLICRRLLSLSTVLTK